MRDALAVARRVGDPWYLAGFGNNLAIIETRLGRYETAARIFEDTLRLNRERGDLAEVAINLLNYAELEVRRGAIDRAAARIEEGARLAREIGFADLAPYFLALESGVALEQGDAERARRLCLEAIDVLGHPAERPDVVDRFVDLGRIEVRRGAPEAAETAFLRALFLARRADHAPGIQRALLGIAEARSVAGRKVEAASLLTALAVSDDLASDLRGPVAVALEGIGAEPRPRPDSGPGATVDAIAAALLRRSSQDGEAGSAEPPE